MAITYEKIKEQIVENSENVTIEIPIILVGLEIPDFETCIEMNNIEISIE